MEQIRKFIWSAVALSFGGILPLGWQGSILAADPFNNIAAPGEKGPYDVGFTTFCATMSAGRVTRVQVYYPVAPNPNKAKSTDCPATYDVYPPGNPALACIPAVTAYSIRSPFCAAKDAPVAPGLFPFILYNHGGGAAGAEYQRMSQLPLHEALASHGFIVALQTHSANAVDRVLDISILAGTMLNRSETANDGFFGRIDPDRIGISGLSAGGQASLLAVGGWAANGIEGDARFKAMVLYEPLALVNLPPIADDIATIAIPYMIMGGDQFRGGIAAIPTILALTALAEPRIFVFNPTALHFSYQSGSCMVIEDAREHALATDPALIDPQTQELIDPFTNLVTNPSTGIRSCKTTMATAGTAACLLWNQGEFQFPINGIGFGSGRNVCTRAGVDSILSLDLDPVDGRTDEPPFVEDDPFNVGPAIPDELLVPAIQHYTVAFWQKFLAGDDRYMRFLTPGYAKNHELNSIVEIVE